MRGPHKPPSDSDQIPAGLKQVPHDEKTFFESFYRANLRGTPEDRMTIGPISDPEARFHYNAVENSIIRALSRRRPPPAPSMVDAWRTMQQRAGHRLLDIGSGTGHWIDFFREVYFVAESCGVELAPAMAEFLWRKYADRPDVRILNDDVCDASFTAERIGGPVDYISAIGVMFHITDDIRWRLALANLSKMLKPGGLMFIGGDFGALTTNAQFHRCDSFENWREFRSKEGTPGEVRVSRRLRSLSLWSSAVADLGLAISDVIRADREPAVTTPENDLLVLEK